MYFKYYDPSLETIHYIIQRQLTTLVRHDLDYIPYCYANSRDAMGLLFRSYSFVFHSHPDNYDRNYHKDSLF